jgi:hypothetical protein
MRRAGVEPAALILARGEGGPPRGTLRLRSAGVELDTPIDLGVGLLVAKQLELSILLIQETAPPAAEAAGDAGAPRQDVPEVFHHLLDQLNWDAG